MRRTRAKTRDIAAYLLDRADQYDTHSPCWIALADAAENIFLGEVALAVEAGELNIELYVRLEKMARVAHAVDPTLGVDDDEDDDDETTGVQCRECGRNELECVHHVHSYATSEDYRAELCHGLCGGGISGIAHVCPCGVALCDECKTKETR